MDRQLGLIEKQVFGAAAVQVDVAAEATALGPAVAGITGLSSVPVTVASAR